MDKLRQSICEALCAYHKPGQYEDPGCAGYEHLLDRSAEPLIEELGKLAPADGQVLFGLEGNDHRLTLICSACTYPPEGCDFRNPDVSVSQCSPCGGLRAIAGLISRGQEPL